MIRLLNISLLAVFCGCLAAVTAAAKDSLTFQDGRTIEGTIQSFDGSQFIFRLEIEGGGFAQSKYDRSSVTLVKLGRTGEEERLLASKDVADLPALEAFWQRRLPYLSIPETDAGEVGVRLIQLLLASRTKKNAALVAPLVETIQKQDWDSSRRSRVAAFRLEALVVMGKTEEALAEAEKLIDLSPDNVATLIDAKFVMAQAAETQLRELEKKNPRWVQVPKLRVERQRFIQEALDGYLFAPALYPELLPSTARGLAAAATLAQHVELVEESYRYAKEVITYFPHPDSVATAQAVFDKVKKLVPADVDEIEPSAPPEKPAAPTRSTPPPTKTKKS